MQFVVNPPNPRKKDYKNLPEREPYKRRKLGEKPEAEADVRTFAPAQSDERASAMEDIAEAPDVASDDIPTSRFSKLTSIFAARTIEDSSYDYEEEPIGWKHSKWTKVLFLGAIALLGTLGYFAFGFEQDLGLERVSVEGTKLLTDKQIIELAGIDRSQRFYKIDLKHIAANIEKHSLVKVSFPRRETNPNTIVLRVEERVPVAMMRSQSTGEALIIDREGIVIRPKKLSGLRNPADLLHVPIISGITEKDTAEYLKMSRLIMEIANIDSGLLAEAIGEFKRTPTGAYVIYTTETQTPIFLGSTNDAPFITAIESEHGTTADPVTGIKPETKQEESHFSKQIKLLARAWRERLHEGLRDHNTLYVDARFAGQIVVKRRLSSDKRVVPAFAKANPNSLMPAAIATNSGSAPTQADPFVVEFTKTAQHELTQH